ncbi:hypothetical protein YC2023_073526 [Brassica napus]
MCCLHANEWYQLPPDHVAYCLRSAKIYHSEDIQDDKKNEEALIQKKRQPNQFSSSKDSKIDSSSPSSFSYEKYSTWQGNVQINGKAPAALFFDDTSGLNSLRCDSFSLLESNYQSKKIVRIHIACVFDILKDDISDSIAFGSHSNIKIWWKWLTIGYAYLGYIIEDDICTVQPFSPTNDIDLTPIFVSQCAMDRRVEQLGWRVIKEDYEKPFLAANLSFRPLTGS